MTCPEKCAVLLQDLKEAVFEPVIGLRDKMSGKVSRKGTIAVIMSLLTVFVILLIYGLGAWADEKDKRANTETKVGKLEVEVINIKTQMTEIHNAQIALPELLFDEMKKAMREVKNESKKDGVQ